MPDLALNLFSLIVAYTRGVGFATDDEDMSVTLAEGRLSFGVMDLDTQTMVEGLTLMTTASPVPCRFPTPSRTPRSPLSLFPWESLW